MWKCNLIAVLFSCLAIYKCLNRHLFSLQNFESKKQVPGLICPCLDSSSNSWGYISNFPKTISSCIVLLHHRGTVSICNSTGVCYPIISLKSFHCPWTLFSLGHWMERESKFPPKGRNNWKHSNLGIQFNFCMIHLWKSSLLFV